MRDPEFLRVARLANLPITPEGGGGCRAERDGAAEPVADRAGSRVGDRQACHAMTSMDISVADRFEAVAQAQPERSAVNAGGQQATYGELAAHAASIAHHLLEAGVEPGDRVALCLERGTSAFAAWLGVLRAGAVVVPLVPMHPVEHLRRLVEDASPRCVLSNSRSWQTACAVADGHASVVDVNAPEAAPARAWPRVRPADPATHPVHVGHERKAQRRDPDTRQHLEQGRRLCRRVPHDSRRSVFAVDLVRDGAGMIVTASALLRGARCAPSTSAVKA